MVTINQGWRLFVKGLPTSKYGSLAVAAEWMYKLNVFSRSINRHPIKDQIYALKNDFIRYLYQHGYSIEVTLQKQDFPCWGTFYDGCTDDCPKCGGTGIYRTEKLYSFRFLVGGVRYAWHQPAKLINYEVKLTDAQVSELTELRKDEAILSMDNAWLGCCVVWWTLLLHGIWSKLLLWESTRSYWFTKVGILRSLKAASSRINDRLRKTRRYFRDLQQERCQHDFGEVANLTYCAKCGVARWRVMDVMDIDYVDDPDIPF